MIYEIWLSEKQYESFERGVAHLEDGSIVQLEQSYHSNTLGPDSSLIRRKESHKYDLRWFDNIGYLGFYVWDNLIDEVVLHNDTSITVSVFLDYSRTHLGDIRPGENKSFKKL